MKGPARVELRLAEIVLSAAELEGNERDSYLRDLTRAEPELAMEARRRLSAAGALGDSFLAIPAAVRLGAEERGGIGERASAAALPAEERYELGETLGEGGMGRVVKAEDRQLGRTVALKLLTHEDPEIVRLFLGEARHQARVKHDHVLEIYDSGELHGQPFLAMQLASEGTLAEVGDGLTLEAKVRLVRQAAEGLHAAHRKGLLHRDIKPSNVLVERTEDGDLRALVTDFGLATEIEDADFPTDEWVPGTPQYIAPERLRFSATSTSASDASAPPSPPTLDRRSDIYSLGVTLYRVLTGELLFSGRNTMEVLRQVTLHDLPPPRQRMPDLPAELEAIILRSIAREPGDRYPSARALAEDLRRYLDGEVVEAYAAGLAHRLTRFALRNKVLVGIAAAAVLVLACSSVAVAVFALRADTARQRAEMRHGQAEELIHFLVFDLRDELETLGRLDILTDLHAAAADYFAAVPDTELSETEVSRR
ncbi:MAG: serine/threonine protein kinase, partial [Holophagales bacterium]|nr:serine/threonine protein kinase [Holophagales bacterium]